MLAGRAPIRLLWLLGIIAGCGGGASPVAESPERQAMCADPDGAGRSGKEGPEAVEASGSEPRDDILRLQVRWGEAEGLTYMEIVVGDTDADARLPLVLGLHGLGDRPRIPEKAELGDGIPYRIVMPRAPDEWGATGYTWLPVRVRDGKIDVLSASLAERADLLARFLRAVQERLPTVGRPIVTGGSQGGMLTFALAVLHPEAVSGAVPVMGWLPPPLVPEEANDVEAYPPIWAVHGEADEVIPIGPTRETIERLRGLGLDVRFETFEGVGHHMSDPMDAQIEAWLVDLLTRQLDAAAQRRAAAN